MITRKPSKTTLITIENTADQRQVIAHDCLDPNAIRRDGPVGPLPQERRGAQ
jgi:hypothetical protein